MIKYHLEMAQLFVQGIKVGQFHLMLIQPATNLRVTQGRQITAAGQGQGSIVQKVLIQITRMEMQDMYS